MPQRVSISPSSGDEPRWEEKGADKVTVEREGFDADECSDAQQVRSRRSRSRRTYRSVSLSIPRRTETHRATEGVAVEGSGKAVKTKLRGNTGLRYK